MKYDFDRGNDSQLLILKKSLNFLFRLTYDNESVILTCDMR